MYRMLTSLYDGEKAEGKSPLEALKSARDALGETWGKALTELPPTGIKFSVVAESMPRTAAKSDDPDTFDRLASVLVDRDVLTPERVAELKTPTLQNVSQGDGSNESVLKSLEQAYDLPQGYVAEGEPKKLGDGRTVYMYTRPERHQVPGLKSLGDDIEVELRSGVVATFDANGQLVSSYNTPVGDEDRTDAEVFAADLWPKTASKRTPSWPPPTTKTARSFWDGFCTTEKASSFWKDFLFTTRFSLAPEGRNCLARRINLKSSSKDQAFRRLFENSSSYGT